jgi:hypothetical protein
VTRPFRADSQGWPFLTQALAWAGIGRPGGAKRPQGKKTNYEPRMMNASVSLDDCGPLPEGEGGELASRVSVSAFIIQRSSSSADPGFGSAARSRKAADRKNGIALPGRAHQGVSLNTTPQKPLHASDLMPPLEVVP